MLWRHTRHIVEANISILASSDFGELVTPSIETRCSIDPHTFQIRRLYHPQHWTPRCNIVVALVLAGSSY